MTGAGIADQGWTGAGGTAEDAAGGTGLLPVAGLAALVAAGAVAVCRHATTGA